MKVYRWGFASLALAIVLTTCGLASGQRLPLEPSHESGQGVTGVFEGWFPDQDGTFTLLMGYYNRNWSEPLDIPIGPDNQIQPGGPDQGQPTHFVPGGRRWGVFTIRVPKDFGDKSLTWSVTANGKTSVVQLNLNVLYRLEPFVDATGRTPPDIGFSNAGPFVNGPIGQRESINAKVGAALPLTVWLADDGKSPRRNLEEPVKVHWIVFRGPGAVKFDNAKPPVEKTQLVSPPPGKPFNGQATTTVTFSAPGDYMLNVQADNTTGGGPAGFQCCWSNAKVNVKVSP